MVQIYEQPDLGAKIGRGLGRGLQALLENKMEEIKDQKAQQKTAQQYQELLGEGFTPQEAGLWLQFTEGGKTHLAKEIVERRQREKSLGKTGLQGEEEFSLDALLSPEGDAISFQEEGEVGLTPKERVARREKFDQRAYETNKKFFDQLDEVERTLPTEKLALSQMRAAQDSGDFESYRNKTAELLTPLIGENAAKAIRSASANVVNTANKEFLMSSLSNLKGRPNQFIEKMITQALANPLYSKEANELIISGLEGLSKLKERRNEIAYEIRDKYLEKGREPPRNLTQMVKKRFDKEYEKWEKDYQDKLKSLLNQTKEEILMTDPSGNQRLVNKKDRSAALKAGYKVAK